MDSTEPGIPQGGPEGESDWGNATVPERPAVPVVLLITEDLEFARDLRAVLSGLAQVRWFPRVAAAVAEILGHRHSSLWIDFDPGPHAGPTHTEEDISILGALRARCESPADIVIFHDASSADLPCRLATLGPVSVLPKDADLVALRRVIGQPPAPHPSVPSGDQR